MSGRFLRLGRQFVLLPLVAMLLQACATPEATAPVTADKNVQSRKGRTAFAPERISQTEAQVIAAVDERNSLFFANDETEIDAVGRAKLQTIAERLKGDDKRVAKITGYTDDLGSPSYNLALSMQRAEAAYKFLRGLGVPSLQLRYTGLGAERVSKSCRSSECRNKMRRVEISY